MADDTKTQHAVRETMVVYKDVWNAHRDALTAYEKKLDVMRGLLSNLYDKADAALRTEVRGVLIACDATAYSEWCSDPPKCAFRGYCPRDRSCGD